MLQYASYPMVTVPMLMSPHATTEIFSKGASHIHQPGVYSHPHSQSKNLHPRVAAILNKIVYPTEHKDTAEMEV